VAERLEKAVQEDLRLTLLVASKVLTAVTHEFLETRPQILGLRIARQALDSMQTVVLRTRAAALFWEAYSESFGRFGVNRGGWPSLSV
jgi:hypothetical protein